MNGGTGGRDDTAAILAALAAHEPDPARAAVTRLRCHAAFDRRRQRSRRAAGSPTWAAWRRSLEPLLVGSLGAVYLAEVLSRAWRLYGF